MHNVEDLNDELAKRTETKQKRTRLKMQKATKCMRVKNTI